MKCNNCETEMKILYRWNINPDTIMKDKYMDEDGNEYTMMFCEKCGNIQVQINE